MNNDFDIAVIHEHDEWHRPLFQALDARGASYTTIDLKHGAFTADTIPRARLYYNLVSPSAYLRGNQRAIPYALALCRQLESGGAMVLNGTKSMTCEFSKSAQISLLGKLGIDHPRTVTFNSIDALRALAGSLLFPMILKPEQGGSGARMYLVNALDELALLLEQQPNLWEPDQLLLLQEKLEYDTTFGIVRLEYIGGSLLYAMRVVTNGAFNLCPSVICNPEDGIGSCEIMPSVKPEFHAMKDVPDSAIATGAAIMAAADHTTGSVEYLVTNDGRRVFYDINSNSNLREPVAAEFGKQPFDELANYLLGAIS